MTDTMNRGEPIDRRHTMKTAREIHQTFTVDLETANASVRYSVRFWMQVILDLQKLGIIVEEKSALPMIVASMENPKPKPTAAKSLRIVKP